MSPQDHTSAAEPVGPQTGLAVLHLFCRAPAGVDAGALLAAEEATRKDGCQVVAAAMLGHKADVGLMVLSPDLWSLRGFQTAVAAAGLESVASYVSLTEVSEYAAGVPEEMKQARLYPKLPPEGKQAFCFYPMSKRRTAAHNWYALGFDERKELMMGHGRVGRTFHGRVLQVITGSTGLDDFEWGVTLFAVHPDDLKSCVYEMRFDEASALYAEFGPFYTGMVGDLADVLDRATVTDR
ncbi:MAG: chlorite dismutase family protein [Acidimicrobiales bacterium]